MLLKTSSTFKDNCATSAIHIAMMSELCRYIVVVSLISAGYGSGW